MSRVAVAVTLLVLVFCSVALAATKKLTASEKGHLHFSKKTITVSHGKVTLKMKNPSGLHLEHGIAIHVKGPDKSGKIVSPGSTSKVTATLAKGTYTFYCPADAHEAEGMKGTLIVK